MINPKNPNFVPDPTPVKIYGVNEYAEGWRVEMNEVVPGSLKVIRKEVLSGFSKSAIQASRTLSKILRKLKGT